MITMGTTAVRRRVRGRLAPPATSLARARSSRRLHVAARAAYRRLPGPARRSLVRALGPLRRRAHVKVSVVVPAYNSEQSGLERMVGSLDAQTMSRREFEVIIVDDGSSDDTLARLRALAATRPHVIVRSIPNSGWSSRPRNVAVGLARGEYVLFMDHDDELFPESLQRAYDYGRRTNADVVNAKETRTKGWSWGWGEFRVNRPPGSHGPVPLLPMTPHKLYRRSFLNEHGIRFPEGKRVLWEDIHYNVACLAAGARVAVLADYPFYHWVATEVNNSATYGRDVNEFWDHLAKLLEGIDEALAGNEWRQALLTHQARGRVLASLGPPLLRRPEAERAVVRERAAELIARYLPVSLDDKLSPVDRARMDVLRRGTMADQVALAELDRGVTAVTRVDDVEWEDGLLVVRATATLVDGDGKPIAFRRDGERWLRDVPTSLAEILSPPAVDLTAALARAKMTVIAKGRRSRSTWPVPTTSEITMVDNGDGTAHVTARAEARFDIGQTAARKWDADNVWDFGARVEAAGYTAQRPLEGGRPVAALTRGRAAVAYENRDGKLSLDVTSAVRSLVETSPPRVEDVDLTVEPGADGAVSLELAAGLTGVHCDGDVRRKGGVLLGADARLPAELVTQDGRAVLRCRGEVAPGSYPVRARFDGRTGNTGLTLTVTDGAARIAAA